METEGNLSEGLVFRPGDQVLLVDRKDRRYLFTLVPGHTFHTHLGALPHDTILGQAPGARITAGGHTFLALRPTLADYIQELPRVTQIIYPKDLGAILVYGDIFPGARVLEAGLGSGALTLALLRAVGPQGCVISYEVRRDYIPRARQNVQALFPEPSNWVIREADVYAGIADRGLDRIILDVPEPWRAVPHAAPALLPGGILLCWLPTVLQVHRLCMALEAHPEFDLVETFEVLLRPWHMSPVSARPVHRMVAHTGFITTARRCAPGKLRVGERHLAEPEGEGYEPQ
ncbi:MAG: tRNA (adenine-N1)-methyltransferase [Dehalococcoidia bacterium]|nr:tRNA (adenine-N1)-methyltransferase [Dehalococcoidia bacterium]MDW8119380.1 tRNA (adenine-N1)-methyltransferase [Chloroflexota bacterium]